MFKSFLLRLWNDQRGELDLGEEPTVGDDADLLAEDSTEEGEGDETTDDEETEETLAEDESVADEEETEETDEDGEVEKEEEEEPEPLPFERPTIKAIKEIYPDIFKKLPSLRDCIFREAAYTKIFPSVEDAQEAQGELDTLSVLRDNILQGDSKNLFEAINKTDKTAMGKIAKTLLPALFESNKDVYFEAVTPLFENLVRTVYNHATRSKDEQLENAALEMSKYLFQTDEVAKGEKTTVKSTKETTEVDRERAAFERERYQTYYAGVSTKIRQSLVGVIIRHVGEDMPKFARTNITNQIIEDIQDKLESNKQHLAIMSARWRSAKLKGYDEASKTSIINTFLARARQLVPALADKYQREWLQSVETHKKRPVSGTEDKKRHTSSETNKGKPKKDYSKMSDMEILAS